MRDLDRLRAMDADQIARWICRRQGDFTREERCALETLQFEGGEKARWRVQKESWKIAA